MRYAMLGLILALNLTVMLVTAETAAAASAKLTNEQCEADRSQLIHCGSAPSAFFSENGSLWVTFEYQQHVWMSRSADNGQTYTPATRVTHAAENIEINGENRPKIIVDEAGATIYVSWTQKTAGWTSGNWNMRQRAENPIVAAVCSIHTRRIRGPILPITGK